MEGVEPDGAQHVPIQFGLTLANDSTSTYHPNLDGANFLDNQQICREFQFTVVHEDNPLPL